MRGSAVTPEIDQCYRALELDAGASLESVKDAWRDLTKVWHPDRFTHDAKLQARAQARMQELNKARKRLEQFLTDNPNPKLRRVPYATSVPKNWIRRRPLVALGIFSGVALLSVWAARSPLSNRFFVDRIASAPLRQEPPITAPEHRSMILVARGPVDVIVTSVIDGAVILPVTHLDDGAHVSVASTKDVFIKYSAGENLQLEIGGERYDMPSPGADRARIR